MFILTEQLLFLGIRMRLNKIALGLAALTLIVLMVPFVFANGVPPPPEPGYSLGYWKHQLKAHYNGRGHMQVSWEDMEDYACAIDWELKSLGQIEEFDYDGDGDFTTWDAYLAFNDPSWNHKWTPIANWFNWAAGYAPYTDND